MRVSLPLSGKRSVSTKLPALVMGILNTTPDSFSEKKPIRSIEEAVERALRMAADGADIIDIGGESTRPGAQYVSLEEELSRVIPVIKLLRQQSSVTISIDTRKMAVLAAALDAGADILNDISAMEDDPSIMDLAASADIPVILVHKRGTPKTMQQNPYYQDSLIEVRDYLFSRASIAQSVGIPGEKIVLDPGIGFGKRYEDNLMLITGLAEIVSGGYPVLMALSRKQCIGQITGRDTADRMAGTLAANMVAVRNGASLLRVHDVAQTCDMLKVLRETETNWNLSKK
ncbi:MAG TPA: dihydropteroate synthase [Treponema sp.]|nr:dihydropteroate synthase [Treponema sp.]